MAGTLKYITVKPDKDGRPQIYVNGKNTCVTHYQGTYVRYPTDIILYFDYLQEACPEVEEVHIGAFNTPGEHAEIGHPSGNGKYTWCRIVQKTKIKTSWVCFDDNYTCDSAHDCLYSLLENKKFRLTVLGATTAAAKLNRYLSKKDLSQLVGRLVYLKGYEIIVNQIFEPEQR